jgi:hypothetical protein
MLTEALQQGQAQTVVTEQGRAVNTLNTSVFFFSEEHQPFSEIQQLFGVAAAPPPLPPRKPGVSGGARATLNRCCLRLRSEWAAWGEE